MCVCVCVCVPFLCLYLVFTHALLYLFNLATSLNLRHNFPTSKNIYIVTGTMFHELSRLSLIFKIALQWDKCYNQYPVGR